MNRACGDLDERAVVGPTGASPALRLGRRKGSVMAREIVTVARADSEADVFMALLEVGRMHQNTEVGAALIEMLRPLFDTVKGGADG